MAQRGGARGGGPAPRSSRCPRICCPRGVCRNVLCAAGIDAHQRQPEPATLEWQDWPTGDRLALHSGWQGAAVLDEWMDFGSNESWRQPLLESAKLYAQQVKKDWQEFSDAYQSGAFSEQRLMAGVPVSP